MYVLCHKFCSNDEQIFEFIDYANSLGLHTMSDLIFFDTGDVKRDLDRLANDMQKFYDDWWEDASKEFRYSYIDIFPNISNTITAHDVQVNSITAWDQSVIRKGIPYELGKFNVDFKKSGEYKNLDTRIAAL